MSLSHHQPSQTCHVLQRQQFFLGVFSMQAELDGKQSLEGKMPLLKICLHDKPHCRSPCYGGNNQAAAELSDSRNRLIWCQPVTVGTSLTCGLVVSAVTGASRV